MSFHPITRCELAVEHRTRNSYVCHGQLVREGRFMICKFHKALAELIAAESLGTDAQRQKVAA